MYENIINDFEELEADLARPEIINDPNKLKIITKKHADLKDLVEFINALNKIEININENQEIIRSEEDSELKKMAEEELNNLTPKKNELKKKIEAELNPADPNDKKNAIIEIRAGTGGDESALFAADLFKMYSRLAEDNGWKIIILNSNRIGIGGFKEVVFEVHGKGTYGILKLEAGTHRVQRVPETEKQGRVHTSAATVAVFPEAEEVDIEIKNEDLRIDTYAASGPGGQKVNTTNSAVRITHTPTGLMVQCQDQKDQHQNKEKAMQILRSRLLAKIEQDKKDEEAKERKEQVGTGDRSGKIRTYNFPQDRVTDHRVKKSWYGIEKIMNGSVIEIIEELKSLKNTNDN